MTGRLLYDGVDGSKRRGHVAGPLALAWLEAMVAQGWLRRVEESLGDIAQRASRSPQQVSKAR